MYSVKTMESVGTLKEYFTEDTCSYVLCGIALISIVTTSSDHFASIKNHASYNDSF
jgi:hypothetical protein